MVKSEFPSSIVKIEYPVAKKFNNNSSMTTLYKDISRDQLIYVNTYDPNRQSDLFTDMSLRINTYKYNNTRLINKLDSMLQYIESYFVNNKEPIVLSRFKRINHLQPLDTWIINTSAENIKNAGLAMNMPIDRAEIHYYEFDPNGEEYPQLITSSKQQGNSVMFCIAKEEGITECELTVYPHFEEEVSVSSISYDLLTQCSVYNKEINVPLQQGSIIILSKSTYYSLHRIKGKGKCHIMIVDLYYD
jgi:hypothetical protein